MPQRDEGEGCRVNVETKQQTIVPIEAVNDFVVKFANVNGSGSASANELFAKAILRMGVPVSPRNIFPSNIQGLPTWYEVRVNETGYQGRRGGVDLMVAMNPQTWDNDLKEIESGGYLFYDRRRRRPHEVRLLIKVLLAGIPPCPFGTRDGCAASGDLTADVVTPAISETRSAEQRMCLGSRAEISEKGTRH